MPTRTRRYCLNRKPTQVPAKEAYVSLLRAKPGTPPTSSTFSELPVEILEIIFALASPSPTHFAVRKSFNCTDLVHFDHKAFLHLSQISSFLRQVVISSSSLWSNIPTVYDIYTRATDHRAPAAYRKRFKLVDLFLERAKRSPLHVTIVDINHRWLHAGKPSFAAARPLMGRCRRWKSLTLQFRIDITFRDFERDLVTLRPEYNEPQLPILENLAIWQKKINMNFLETPLAIFSKAPMLKHVHFVGMDINQMVDLPWNQIISYNGALLQFDSLRGCSSTVKELNLQRNLQFFENPKATILFDQLEKVRFENVNFLHKLPKHYGDWRLDGTVLRSIEAPKLRTLEFARYQVLKEAPSIIDDLLMTALRFPHDTLQRLVFHIGGIPQQSLVDLLHSVPNLEILDLWDTPTDHFSILNVEIDAHGSSPGDATWKRPVILVPKLRTLIVREWSDSKAGTLVGVYDSRRLAAAQQTEVVPMDVIELKYQRQADCLQAQDRIEGWDEARKVVYRPRTDYQKVHGFSRHAVQRFLEKGDARNPAHYAVKKPRIPMKYTGESNKGFLKDIENYQDTETEFLEMSRLGCVLSDIKDEIEEQPSSMKLNTPVYSTAAKLTDKWRASLNPREQERRWKIMGDFLTLKLCSN